MPDPYVVGWSAQENAALEHAMSGAVAVVAYDCDVVRVLDCRAEGGYAFAALPELRRESTHVDDSVAPETSSADLEIAYVGTMSARAADASARLSGSECEQATHLVQRAWIGAFRLQERSDAERSVSASASGVSFGADVSRSRSATRASGDLDACATVASGAPPATDCRAPIRVELVALASRPNERR